MFVPVVDINDQPLMPTIPSRARRWMESGKAKPFWRKGIFCVKLTKKTKTMEKQPIAVGIDTGIKKEAFTVKSKAHTYLNIQSDAVTWVGHALEARRALRKHRRKSSPCRQPRRHRLNCRRWLLPPSIKARWDTKLRIVNTLSKIFPISNFVVEDVSARPRKGKRRWNISFSPLQSGKNYFYDALEQKATLTLRAARENSEYRKKLGLKKSTHKMANKFECHCVDSWTLANSVVGGHEAPENRDMHVLTPLRIYRRILHDMQPGPRGIRNRYGGTMSLGFKKGSLVKHPTYGLKYVGGYTENKNGRPSGARLTLHDIETGVRVSRAINPKDLQFICFNTWRWRTAKAAVN